ncbi:MAG: hypothetical protein ACYSSO_08320 [Planctomycetota bacterium]|jgi:hypothetical protein
MFKKVFCFVTGVLFVLTLAGCGSVLDRSLIFATHTTVGVEVSVSPVETGNPVALIIGYKRTEGVINPVYDKEGISTCPNPTSCVPIQKYRDKAYSVIAKLEGKIAANANPSSAVVSGAQWFATGEAANNVSSHPEFAVALTDNPAIAKQASEAIKARAKAEAEAKEKIKLSNTPELKALKKKYRQLTKPGATFVAPAPTSYPSGKAGTPSGPKDYANDLASIRVPGETAEGIMTRGPLEDARFIIKELEKYVKQ